MWDEEQIYKYQIDSLRRILKTAFDHVPNYQILQKQLGCYHEDFKRIDALRYLPILEKSSLRGNEREFINQTSNLRKCTHGFTSGTIGTPINLYESQESSSYRM